MKDYLGIAFTCLVAGFMLWVIVSERLHRRRVRRRLRTRVDSGQTGDAAWGDPATTAIAARVQKVLAANLRIPLDGLQSKHRLNEDLEAELPANPHLFWELEQEFAIRTEVEHCEEFEQVLGQLVTVGDLVKYVEQKITAGQAPRPEPVEPPVSSKVYDYAIRTLPFLFLCGFLIVVAGAVMRRSWAIHLGTFLFLLGVVVWGLANGGSMIWQVVCTAREEGLGVFRKHPWGSLFLLSLGLFLLWTGGSFLWMLVKGLSGRAWTY